MNDLATVDIETLKAKHHDLDRVISKEEKRNLPDEERIATLKKEKLQLKDRITLLESQLH